MKIPKQIRIGGIDYDVVYEDRLNNGVNLIYGHIDHDKALIRIAKDLQTKQGEFQTLLHEVIHGITHHYDLDLGDNEEDIVDKIAKGIFMVMQDNKDLFK